MAIITGTALIAGSAAVTAATVAAGVGFAASAATTAVSLNQAKKQRDAQVEAEDQADKALASARERLEVNYLEGLSIQKEPYELQREALLAGGAQALQAAQSGERGVSAAAGRVAIAQQAGQAEIRTAMGKEMADLELMGLKEESRLRDAQAGLDVREAEGATLAAQQASIARAQANQGVVSGIGGMVKSAGSAIPEYLNTGSKAKGGADQSMMNQAFGQAGLSQDEIIMNQAGLGRETNLFPDMNLDIPALGGISNKDRFDQYIKR
mgnify:FL=1|jgi:hypothetical protein|tara:strand:- start:132 stop:932 length:801 start_codon:yes stop_codon:yes gene_type:complete